MTTFITFTETRKKFIDFMRDRVITERPVRRSYVFCGVESVTIDRPLKMIDYAVYAALRGADYRKGDHTGGVEATKELEWIVKMHKQYNDTFGRFISKEATAEENAEFVEIIEAELARWKDAPVS